MNRIGFLRSLAGVAASVLFAGIVTGSQNQNPSASISQPQTQSPAQEVDLVRKLYEARDNYQISLERLRSYYSGISSKEKFALASKELFDFHLQIKNPFVLELDLPPADLKGDTTIPEANRLYGDAISYLGTRSIMDRGDNTKRAELIFRKIIREFPRTDKLDECCYYLGEIYSSKFFQQYDRSVAFYERTLLYEKNTPLDARIRAARIYEKHLKEKRRAVELYEEVLRRGDSDAAQTREATKRLEELTGIKSNSGR